VHTEGGNRGRAKPLLLWLLSATKLQYVSGFEQILCACARTGTDEREREGPEVWSRAYLPK
jgi:hypothetical protein